ncbi:hypothetical protein [Chryseobacterium sp. Hurlbut01]|uniref:hypothetical protein n=1 Tax=Chryseobacterium sp. Hurlbut01 TaxID=1681828 RepID=UPI00128D8C64|nr:hypothetical protein [Chryseobacterium sp. Hurlbut01]
MHPYHRSFIYAQVLFLFWTIFVLLVFPQWQFLVFPLLSVFFLLEIGVLETQRKENPEAVRYRKSGLFSLLDLLSVTLFLINYISCGIDSFNGNIELNPLFLSSILGYIIVRKLYITKNYSYDK